MSATDSPEHLLTCLARWILDRHDAVGVRVFLARWRARHGRRSYDRLRAYVAAEYRARRAPGAP